jgi:DNA gyrase/topoisomerase IV subunit A
LRTTEGSEALSALAWQRGEEARAEQMTAWRRRPLAQAILCREDAPLLLGSLWSKFVLAQANQLFDADAQRVNLPRHLQPEAAIGDRYVLAVKLADVSGGDTTLLVTHAGFVRAFAWDFIEKQLHSYNQWRLEKAARPNMPTALLAANKADEVVLLSTNGRAIRLNLANLSVRGQTALKLKEPEAICAARLNNTAQIWAVSPRGRVVAYPTADIPVAPPRGGVGKQIARNDTFCGLLPDQSGGRPLALTSWGRILPWI